MTPTVTICVPTFNRAGTLRDTLLALRQQTFGDWETIVGDDASTDNTQDVVESFADPRIQYCRHPKNLGIYGNWNRLIELARGRYICIYHDHDLYLPTIVERCARILDEHETVQFVHTALFVIDDGGQPAAVDIRPFPEILPGDTLRRVLATGWHSPVMAATAMVRKEAYARVGRYEFERYGLGCDKDMWFRLAALGDVGYVTEPQALIRARTKAGPTSAFNWQTVAASIRMRADQLAEAYPGDSREGERFAHERDRRILTLIVRAILMEPPDIVTEGLELAVRDGSAGCRAAASWLVRRSRVTRIVGRPLLQAHYALQRRRLARQRERARGALAKYPRVLLAAHNWPTPT